MDRLLKEIIKEETKVELEFHYLEMIAFVMNPLMSRDRLAIKMGHIMRRLWHAIQETPQPKPWTRPNQVNLQRPGIKYGLGRVRSMEGVEDKDKAENPKGHQDQEQADPELSIAEIQEMNEVEVQELHMSGPAGAGASSILKCPACGKGRHSRKNCWVLHPRKAPEWLQDTLRSKIIGKGGQVKPHGQGGCKGEGSPHKGGKSPPCKGC